MTNRVPSLIGQVGGVKVRFPLTDGTHVVGRADDCDLKLEPASVSRRHAKLSFEAGKLLIEDLGSQNGTRVNNRSVTDPTPLSPGDEVAFADVVFNFAGVPSLGDSLSLNPKAESAAIAVSWDEMQSGVRSGPNKRSRLFKCLARAGDLITVPRAPEELFEPILDLVDSAMEPERAFLLLREKDEAQPVIRASRYAAGSNDENVTLSWTMISRVMEERTSFLLRDEENNTHFMQQQSIVSQGIRSVMATPLFDNKKVIGILYADTTDPSRHYTRDELVTFSLLANVIAVALTHARYDALEAEKNRLDTELDAARSIIKTIIPDILPVVSGYDICAHFEPCFEVGGDLYDICTLPDGRVTIVVGDVSGKGLGAALLVSSMVPLLRAMLEIDSDLSSLAANLNRQLNRITGSLRYCTLFVGVLDPVSGHLEYVNAGHNPPVLVRGDGSLETAVSTGTPVALLPEGAWRTAEMAIAPGELLVLNSDGIPETWQNELQDYGDERFQKLLVTHRDQKLDDLRDTVLADVKAFRGDAPVGDDTTLLLIRRK